VEGSFVRTWFFAFLFGAAAALAACGEHGRNGLPQTPQSVVDAGSSAQRSHADGAKYRIVNLGTLGGATSGGNSINNLGWVTGISSLLGSPGQHATLWRGHATIDLGTLGGADSGVEWPVKNDRGIIAGISETATPDPYNESWSCASFFPTNGHTCLGFVWKNHHMQPLPTLGGNNGYAAGVNGHGQIAGWAETTVHDPTCEAPNHVLQFEAVVWEPNAMPTARALQPFGHDPDGAATAINDAGQVVGISGTCDQQVGRFSARHAVMWQDGVPMNLGSLGGVAWNTPTAINAAGEVVGFSDRRGDKDGTPNFHAFAWTKGRGMVDLKTLPGDAYSEALGINDRGQIVGVSYAAGFASSRAVIWQHGKMSALRTLLPKDATLAPLYANDINDTGEISGGACVLVSGTCSSNQPAFLAIPTR
jgi:probable HAF family extracellular repeat protein